MKKKTRIRNKEKDSKYLIIILLVALIIAGLIYFSNKDSMNFDEWAQFVHDYSCTKLDNVSAVVCEKILMYPRDGIVKIKAGKSKEMYFGIVNYGNSGLFSYQFSLDEVSRRECLEEDRFFIKDGEIFGNFELETNGRQALRKEIVVPKNSISCSYYYDLEVLKNGKSYARDTFRIDV